MRKMRNETSARCAARQCRADGSGGHIACRIVSKGEGQCGRIRDLEKIGPGQQSTTEGQNVNMHDNLSIFDSRIQKIIAL